MRVFLRLFLRSNESDREKMLTQERKSEREEKKKDRERSERGKDEDETNDDGEMRKGGLGLSKKRLFLNNIGQTRLLQLFTFKMNCNLIHDFCLPIIIININTDHSLSINPLY